MTLLSTAQRACDVAGLPRPAALLSSTDPFNRQVLALAIEVLDELCLMNWPILNVPYTFNTVANQSQYDLPEDFKREMGDTMYAASQYTQLRGSLTPADWARQRDTLQAQYGRYRYRIFGLPLKINVSPTPTAVEALTFEYQTTYKVQQADTTYKNTFFADSDVPLVDEDLFYSGLKWRLRRVKGLDYSEEFNEYEVDKAKRLAQALQLGSMPVSYRYPYDVPDGLGFYIPENGYGN
jgi:hypothetical protein